MKVKVFEHYESDGLENEINEWIEENPKVNITSVHYAMSCSGSGTSRHGVLIEYIEVIDLTI